MRHMRAFRHSVIVRAASTRRKKTLKKCVLLRVSLNNTYVTRNNCSETCNGKNSLVISCDSFITPDQNCAFFPSLFPFYLYHVWQCEQIVYLYLWFKRASFFKRFRALSKKESVQSGLPLQSHWWRLKAFNNWSEMYNRAETKQILAPKATNGSTASERLHSCNCIPWL